MAKKPTDFEDRRKRFVELCKSPQDHLTILRGFEMEPVARVTFENKSLAVCCFAEWNGKWPGVYAFVAEERVVRVGSTAKKVRDRLGEYRRDIKKRLENPGGTSKRGTPLWEAKLWEYIYGDLTKEPGEVWARKSEEIETRIGTASAKVGCKAEESIVSHAFRTPGLDFPVLNDSTRFS